MRDVIEWAISTIGKLLSLLVRSDTYEVVVETEDGERMHINVKAMSAAEACHKVSGTVAEECDIIEVRKM